MLPYGVTEGGKGMPTGRGAVQGQQDKVIWRNLRRLEDSFLTRCQGLRDTCPRGWIKHIVVVPEISFTKIGLQAVGMLLIHYSEKVAVVNHPIHLIA